MYAHLYIILALAVLASRNHLLALDAVVVIEVVKELVYKINTQ